MNKKIKIIIALLVVIVISTVSGVVFVKKMIAPLNTGVVIRYEVKSGANLKTVLKDLQTQKVIKNADIAHLYSRIFKKTKLVSGKFNISSNQSLEQILETISNPTKLVHDHLVVPLIEGKWAIHYAEKLSEILKIPAKNFIDKWNDKNYVRSLKNKYFFITDDTLNRDTKVLLEGYLAPDTYYFTKNETVETVTEKILNNTLKRLTEFKNQLQNKNIHEILTQASLVQYEAKTLEDMQKIAYVTTQRIAKKMKIEYSVTVCYALYEKLNDWKQCEQQTNVDSKYNTYRNYGLPPGPISNPSRNAIYAVLNPIKHDYLFFVADVCRDSKIYYSKTYAEHEAKVKQYLRDTKCLP